MVTHLPHRILDRLFDASLVTIMDLPPKDPHDDDDESGHHGDLAKCPLLTQSGHRPTPA
jgi:hypothetical protein